MATLYSPFFSSGLLAAHTPRRRVRRGTVSSDASESWNDSDSAPPSPAQASSPVSKMDVDVEYDSAQDSDCDHGKGAQTGAQAVARRSATPTQHPAGGATPAQLSPSAVHQQSRHDHHEHPHPAHHSTAPCHGGGPRLRRRRSSLTQPTTPLAAIRAPSARAGHAHALHVTRARSGSLGGALAAAAAAALTMNEANADGGVPPVPLLGRARSGSCSGTVGLGLGIVAGQVVPAVGLRPRRAVRRAAAAPLPGLRAPPPTAPLPELPRTPIAPSMNVDVALSTSVNVTTAAVSVAPAHTAITIAVPAITPSAGGAKPTRTSARARGLSVSGSMLDGVEHRIEEDGGN